MELYNGEVIRKPIMVQRPPLLSKECGKTKEQDTYSLCLSNNELIDLNKIEYKGREANYAPGVIVRKGAVQYWSPIATGYSVSSTILTSRPSWRPLVH